MYTKIRCAYRMANGQRVGEKVKTDLWNWQNLTPYTKSGTTNGIFERLFVDWKKFIQGLSSSNATHAIICIASPFWIEPWPVHIFTKPWSDSTAWKQEVQFICRRTRTYNRFLLSGSGGVKWSSKNFKLTGRSLICAPSQVQQSHFKIQIHKRESTKACVKSLQHSCS